MNTSESVTSEYQLRSFFDVGLFEVTCIVLPGNHKHIAIFQCGDNTIVIDPIGCWRLCDIDSPTIYCSNYNTTSNTSVYMN